MRVGAVVQLRFACVLQPAARCPCCPVSKFYCSGTKKYRDREVRRRITLSLSSMLHFFSYTTVVLEGHQSAQPQTFSLNTYTSSQLK